MFQTPFHTDDVYFKQGNLSCLLIIRLAVGKLNIHDHSLTGLWTVPQSCVNSIGFETIPQIAAAGHHKNPDQKGSQRAMLNVPHRLVIHFKVVLTFKYTK